MATIYDVAKAADVSPKTAARILSGNYGGRPKNRDSVLTAAKQLGYVRNQQAANLRSGRSRLLGVVVPDIQNPYYPVFYQHIHDAAVARGYHILLSSTSRRVAEEKHALSMFEMNRVEGVILNTSEGETDEECDEILARLIKSGVAAIVSGRTNHGLLADESMIKNVDAVIKAVTYLNRTGHKKLAFISGSLENLAAKERLEGFKQGLAACNLPVESAPISVGEFTTESGFRLGQALLKKSDRPSAIVAANDPLAIGIVQAAQSLGLRVPQDLAVIGFDDNPLAQLVSPKLTTLRIPIAKIAADSVEAVLERAERRDDPQPPRRLEYEADLIIRESA